MPAAPTPGLHPMDPRRSTELSPKFAAILCHLIGIPPMTDPAITRLTVTDDRVFAITTSNPCFDTFIGSWTDLAHNLREWGAACAAEPQAVETLLAKARGAAS